MYRLEFFASAAADPSGFGQGQTFLGFKVVTTDGSGNVSFTATTADDGLAALPAGQSIVTATATDITLVTPPGGGSPVPQNDTSEFSRAFTVGDRNPWHNYDKPLDVRGGSSVTPDDFVDAGDALAIINYVNTFGSTEVPEDAQVGLPFGFLDVNNDDNVAADDALTVINAINSGLGGEGESRNAEFRMQNAEWEGENGRGGERGSGPLKGVAQERIEELIELLAVDASRQAGRRRRM
jgi:hypothetical protein